jgi:hypothetical protein
VPSGRHADPDAPGPAIDEFAGPSSFSGPPSSTGETAVRKGEAAGRKRFDGEARRIDAA